MPAKKEKALGSGLSALFQNDTPIRPVILPLSKIEPRETQPRQQFDAASLQELANSIIQYGLLQPITVRPLSSGTYQIIAGERRWRAAQMAGLQDVPVRVVDADDKKAQELALVENLQREDLSPLEEARGFRSLLEDYGLTQEEVAQSIGKSRSAVANSLRLLSLPEPIQDMVEEGELTAGHARALLTLETEELQQQAAKQILKKGLSVRQTEDLTSSLKQPPKEKPDSGDDEYTQKMGSDLGKALGRNVRIVDGKKKGRIELEYHGAEDREKLLQALFTLTRQEE